LAGGKGTRLRRVVKDRPKPMAKVAGRPFLEWLLLSIRAQGVRRAIICTGHMSEIIEGYFGDGGQWDMEVVYSCDPVPLGTGGAVRFALNQVHSDRFLVMNGDSYCRIDIDCLVKKHVICSARATISLIEINDCRRYGYVTIDEKGNVQCFHEKPHERCSGLINAGIYLLEREAVLKIPDGEAVSIETDFFPLLIGHGLYAEVGKGPFLDIGTPESYASADKFFAELGLGDNARST
jgi:NDP-sugar pyrophosphorylase family protein